MNPTNSHRVSLTMAALGMVGVIALGASCSSEPGSTNDDRGWGDAGIATRDDGKTHVVNQPDGYANVSMKCDGKYGYMVIVVTHSLSDTSPVVIPDPRCPGYRKDLVAPGQPAPGGAPRPADDE